MCQYITINTVVVIHQYTNLLTDIDILLMVEIGVREGICHSIYRYAKANGKCMKDYDKNKESLYLQYWGK